MHEWDLGGFDKLETGDDSTTDSDFEAEGDLEVRHDLDFHKDWEDCGDVEVEIGDSLGGESKGDSTILDGQSIWGLMRLSQGIPRMME